MGGSVPNKEKNTEDFVVSINEVGLEVNYDKTKYIVMFRDLTEEEVTIMKTDHSSLDRVEGFKCLGTDLTNQNSIQE